MFRKLFASFMLAGVIALTLTAYFAAGASAASESFVFRVQPGQYLVKLVRAAGWKDEDYIKIVALNPKIWPEQELYHKSHNFVPAGLELRVPQDVAVALGLVPSPASAVIEPAPAVRSVVPLAPLTPEFKSAIWPDVLFLALVAFLIVFLLHEFRKGLKRMVGRARETAGRGLRELINCFFPTALQPCVATGVYARDVAALTGWDPNALQLRPAYGEFDVNIKLADGSLRSERRVLNGESRNLK